MKPGHTVPGRRADGELADEPTDGRTEAGCNAATFFANLQLLLVLFAEDCVLILPLGTTWNGHPRTPVTPRETQRHPPHLCCGSQEWLLQSLPSLASARGRRLGPQMPLGVT